jgi:hypothetical protein
LRVRVPPTTDRQRLLDAAGRFASDAAPTHCWRRCSKAMRAS